MFFFLWIFIFQKVSIYSVDSFYGWISFTITRSWANGVRRVIFETQGLHTAVISPVNTYNFKLSLSLICRLIIIFSSQSLKVFDKFSLLFICSFQESLDVMSTNDDNTLGFSLELYSRYMESARVCITFLETIGN